MQNEQRRYNSGRKSVSVLMNESLNMYSTRLDFILLVALCAAHIFLSVQYDILLPTSLLFEANPTFTSLGWQLHHLQSWHCCEHELRLARE